MPELTVVKRVDEVNLLLSVTTRRGKLVRDLDPSDLVISDNGEPPEKITYFQKQTDLPLRVALVIDVSDSERLNLAYEQRAARAFLERVLRDRDMAAVISFNQTASVVQPPTQDVAKLAKAISMLSTGGETSVFDAVALAADSLAQISDAEPVRRVIILVTDGADNRSRVSLEQATEHALRAETVIYVVDTKGPIILGPEDKAADHVTKHLSEATGGRTFSGESESDVSGSFRRIRDELRSQYAIGYRPRNLLTGLLFRTVQILGPKGIRIRHRAGYYAH